MIIKSRLEPSSPNQHAITTQLDRKRVLIRHQLKCPALVVEKKKKKKKFDFVTFVTFVNPRIPLSSLKKIQPIRSSRLAGQREHIYEGLVLLLRLLITLWDLVAPVVLILSMVTYYKIKTFQLGICKKFVRKDRKVK